MHFQQSLIALAAALTFTSTAFAATSIPDGEYTVTNLEDGGQLWSSLTDSSVKIEVKTEDKRNTLSARSAKFAKRRTDCWSTPLDHAGVDDTLNALRGWANTGTTLSSGDRPQAFGYVSRGVYSYYCITRPNTSGNLDINDVNHAIREMDNKCAAYTASWYGWDGSSELVGKAPAGAEICTGPF